ncbi:Calcium-transporting ATPase [Actinidia chinensis var. chinensis]|uniref:Calcium-transporting ATPase n=1 Tax=Actinidia chinensis var. chinensis TaxID=1590841 RepID=A0A2R6Q3G9_ACTCC|nr:Calcium-transporting ATPase [Actinidia chinensis var. chinensis]
MSTNHQSRLHGLENFVNQTTTSLAQTSKVRWQTAIVAIYCSRVFYSLLREAISTTTAPVQSNPQPTIDQSNLTNQEDLNQFDGVEGLTTVPKANLQSEINGYEEDVANPCDDLKRFDRVEGLKTALEANLQSEINGHEEDVANPCEDVNQVDCVQDLKTTVKTDLQSEINGYEEDIANPNEDLTWLDGVEGLKTTVETNLRSEINGSEEDTANPSEGSTTKTCRPTTVPRSYSTKALFSLGKELCKKFSRARSYTVVDVEPDRFSSIDRSRLCKLVNEKNADLLLQVGGVEGVIAKLESNAENGIHGRGEDIASRHKSFGSNSYQKPPAKTFHVVRKVVIEAFKDPMILLLLVCASLSVGFGTAKHGLSGLTDGGSIFAAIFLVILVFASSNFWPRKEFNKLSQASDNIQVDVRRNGQPHQIPIFDVVVGDVILLKVGDQVPADGLFLDGQGIKVDESNITEETDTIEVNHSHKFLLSGSKVVDGSARMLVTSVGVNTKWGQIMKEIACDSYEPTPLQTKLKEMTSFIAVVGILVALMVLVILLIRYFMGNKFASAKTDILHVLNDVAGILATPVVIAVAAIPEGLLLSVKVALAYSTKSMLTNQAIVKKLSACETMAFVTTICTDKKYCFILSGLVGLKDSVRAAVIECQGAGVNIIMTTEDDMSTARAVATECSIIEQDHDIATVAVEGMEFENYTDNEKMEKINRIRVMARASPSHKHIMVQCLKQNGHVVAVTGDSTGDAMALREANVGLSTGIHITDSDFIILDNNFVSLVKVLRWGRGIYINIQTFTQFQLTVSITSLVIDSVTAISASELPIINIVAAISAGTVPYATLQLLWVKLIVGTLAALALMIEQPTKDVMQKPPVNPREPFITNIMWRNMLAQGLYQIAILLTLQFKGESIFNVSTKVKDTMIFNAFVFFHISTIFNARTLEMNIVEAIHRKKLFCGIIGTIIVLQVVMVEFLNRFADTERLCWGKWGACLGIAAVSWLIGRLVKFIPVPERPFCSYFFQLVDWIRCSVSG